MTEINVRFPFEPKPKLRPRFKVRYNRVLTFTPTETKAFEAEIAKYYTLVSKGFIYDQHKPINVTLHFALPIPKGTSKKKVAAMVEGLELPTKKPDIDNLVKSVLDALNGIAWYDDNQIVTLSASKEYSEEPHIDLTVREVL